MFPTGKQYHRYVRDYATSRNFNIHLGVEVISAYPEGHGWRVPSARSERYGSISMVSSDKFRLQGALMRQYSHTFPAKINSLVKLSMPAIILAQSLILASGL